jgi:hypothetical protein
MKGEKIMRLIDAAPLINQYKETLRDVRTSATCECSEGEYFANQEAQTLLNDFIGALTEAPNIGHIVPQWVNIKDAMPPDNESAFLVIDETEFITVGYTNWLYRNPEGHLRMPAKYGAGMNVTHWHPLPTLPPK